MKNSDTRYVIRVSRDGLAWMRLDLLDNKYIAVHGPRRAEQAAGWVKIAAARSPAIWRGTFKIAIFEEPCSKPIAEVVHVAPPKPAMTEPTPIETAPARRRGRPRKVKPADAQGAGIP